MKIKQKLLLIFVVASVIPAATLAWLNSSNTKSFFERSGQNKIIGLTALEAMAKLKADYLEKNFQDIKAGAVILQESYTIKLHLPIIIQYANNIENPKYARAKENLDSTLKTWMKMKSEISNIALVDTDGKIVYAASESHWGKDLGGALGDPGDLAFQKGKTGVYMTEVFFHKHKDAPSESHHSIIVAAPVNDLQGTFLGVVALAIKLDPIFRYLQDYSGLGDTGETLLGEKFGDQVLYLTPLRHEKTAPLTKSVPAGEEDLATGIQLAAQGQNGSGTITDYRGKSAMAAWRYLPSLGWGILVKIDTEEAFRELNGLRNLNLLILTIVLFIVAAAGMFVARSIAYPIETLTRTVNDISKGKLDAKLEKIDTKDEVGNLARAFERTVVSLKLAMRAAGPKQEKSESRNNARRNGNNKQAA